MAEKPSKDLSSELRKEKKKLYKKIWDSVKWDDIKERMGYLGVADRLLQDPKILARIKKKVNQSKTPQKTAIKELI